MFNEQEIRKLAEELEIPLIGFTGPEDYDEWLDILKERRNNGQITDFERTKPEKRICYDGCLENVKTIIVIGIPYPSKCRCPEAMQLRGRIATVAWGKDYHTVLTEKMNELVTRLKMRCSGLKARCYVDNSRLLDRAAAHRAGLGFYGKNNMLIHPKYGSRFFIGQILIDQQVDYEPVKALECQCGSCTACLNACPNQALGNGFSLSVNRCISYLTQKKTLTEEEKQLFGSYLYGCDICQNVCPYNKGREQNYEGDPENIYPKLEKMITMDNETFERFFKHTAAGWRGKKILARNAEIIQEKIIQTD